jgi:BirA family biotin operon repressor/biotin-[acetyl-CoA-carboxylase] ligase
MATIMDTDFDSFRVFREPLPPPFSQLIVLDETDSTNDHAKRLLAGRQAGHGTVVVANSQSRGRGRLERTWESPPDVGLWVSLVLKPEQPLSQWFLFTFLSAVSVGEAIEEIASVPVRLKWPNDVLIRGKKCCGILLETTAISRESFVIVGVGVNVNQVVFPDDLKDIATSLQLEAGLEVSRLGLLRIWLDRFADGWKTLDGSVLERWRKMVDHWGQSVMIIQSDGSVEGVARDVGDDGALIVEVDGALRRIYSGDVKVRRTT